MPDWPPAFEDWSTRSACDAFYASPQFLRLLQPRLESLLVYPSQIQLKPGDSLTFTAKGLGQNGRDFELGELRWTATGGKIQPDGVFKAGADKGEFLVDAQAGAAAASSSVRTAEGRTPPPTPPPKRRLVWNGDVPAQKWTNFYMKVLPRLVSTGNVKLSVPIAATPKEGVTDQQFEETKAGLRG